ncbi:MAG: LysR family transcriptional regulator [Pseudoclavibacter sp.]
MAVTLHGLTCFLAVARTLHFGRAAAEVNLSVSSLSEQIAKLEREVGRKLFARHSRSVALTESGAQLVPLAASAVAAVDEIDAWSAGEGDATIDIGVAILGLGFRALLSAAATRLPRVKTRLRPLGITGTVPALRRREVDCAVAVALDGAQPYEGLHAIELGSEPLVVVMPTVHRLAREASVRPEELWGETLLGAVSAPGGADPAPLDWFAGIDPNLPERCDIRQVMNASDEAMELVSAGAGLSIAGAISSDLYSRPGLAFVPLEVPKRVHTLLLVRDETPTPALRALVDLAVATAGSVAGQRASGHSPGRRPGAQHDAS